MTTKRAGSAEPTAENDNNKQPRTESASAAEEPSTNSLSTSEQPQTTSEEDTPLPPVSDDVEPRDDAPEAPVETEEKEEEPTPEEESTEVKRGKGIKIDELKNVKVMYAEGNQLVGWPEDEQDEVLYPFDEKLNEKVYIWKGDITTLEIDCIVNAANKSLMGGGGVDGAIHSAAGPSLLTECSKLNGAKTGETKLTGGHALPAAHIAHTVGPIYSRNKKRESEDLLRSCYKTTLELCVENGLKSVAFSGISTGIYGYPIEDAARVACDEVRKFLESDKGQKIDQVIFCNFRPVDVSSYVDNLPSYFPPPPRSKTSDEKTSSTTEAESSETAKEIAQKSDRPDDADETMTSEDKEENGAVAQEGGGGKGEQETKKSSGKVPEGKASARKTGKQTHAAGVHAAE